MRGRKSRGLGQNQKAAGTERFLSWPRAARRPPRLLRDPAGVMCDPGDVTRGPAPSLALAPPAPLLRGFRVILASASPRRSEIFGLTVREAGAPRGHFRVTGAELSVTEGCGRARV